MNDLCIVAGPNGSGKTTFAREYLEQNAIAYLSADAIAEQIAPQDPMSARVEAGRRFMTALRDRLARRESLLIETTLSGVGFRRLLSQSQRLRYATSMVYIYLDSPETCTARIAERVRKGGHDVPVDDIQRRFWRSIRNFWTVYRGMVDSWVLVYNALGRFQDVATGSEQGVTVRDSDLFSIFMRLLEVSEDGK